MGHNGAGCEEKTVETRKFRANRQELGGERSLCTSSASQRHKHKATQFTEQIKRGQARVHNQFLLCYPRYHGRGWKRAACVLFYGYIAPSLRSLSESKTNQQGTSSAAAGSALEVQSLDLDPNSTQMAKDCKI